VRCFGWGGGRGLGNNVKTEVLGSIIMKTVRKTLGIQCDDKNVTRLRFGRVAMGVMRYQNQREGRLESTVQHEVISTPFSYQI